MRTFIKKTLKNGLNQSFITAQHLVPQKAISKQVGKLADSNHPIVKRLSTQIFSQIYGISLDDYARKQLQEFDSFNDFFTRELAPNARTIDADAKGFACPADGSVSQLGRIQNNQVLQAKGKAYSLENLLACTQDARYFYEGSFATVYLAPSNYHRVHMPFDATLIQTRYVPGDLFSVNNLTAQHVDNLFARNERMICLFDAEYAGKPFKMAVVLVGAMIVAGIETIATGRMQQGDSVILAKHNIQLKKGDELGRFYLGSTAIMLIPKDISIAFATNENATVYMGQQLATITA